MKKASLYFHINTLSLFVILFNIGIGNNIVAQTKYERESKISHKEVPKPAKEFINATELDLKIQWFRELSNDRTSFEAKFKLNKDKFSVEFDSLGKIQDIEFNIDINRMGHITRKNIEEYLSIKYSNYKVEKWQEQWTGEEIKLVQSMRTLERNDVLTLKYEGIIRVLNGKKYETYEFLFNKDGTLLSQSLIIESNRTNLDF